MRETRTLYKTIMMFLVPTCLTVVVLYLLFRKVDLPMMWASMRQIHPVFLLTAFSISVFCNIAVYALIRCKIWRIMGVPVSYRESVFIRLGSLPFQAIPTFKDTGLAKAIYLKKFFAMPMTEGVLSNIIANIFSVTAIISLAVAGALANGINVMHMSQINQPLLLRVVPVIGVISFVLYAFYFHQPFGKKMLFHVCFKRNPDLYRIFEKNMHLWKKLPGVRLFSFFALALAFKLAEVSIFFVLAQAYSLNIPFSAILLFVPLAMIISESPANISGLGVREGALVLFFWNFAAKETLVAMAVLVFVFNRLCPLILGLVFCYPFFSRLGVSWKSVRAMAGREGINSFST